MWCASLRGFSRISPMLLTTTVSAARINPGSGLSSLSISSLYTARAFCVAVASTYSYGESDFDRFSSNFDGITSTLVRPICARRAFRRGDAEAKMTRLPGRGFSAGGWGGGGGRRWRGGAPSRACDGGCVSFEAGTDSASYDGGASVGSPDFS